MNNVTLLQLVERNHVFNILYDKMLTYLWQVVRNWNGWVYFNSCIPLWSKWSGILLQTWAITLNVRRYSLHCQDSCTVVICIVLFCCSTASFCRCNRQVLHSKINPVTNCRQPLAQVSQLTASVFSVLQISRSWIQQITMTSPGGPLTLLLLLLLLLMMTEDAQASCSAAGRCCEGKDNGCRGVVVYSNSLRLENLLYGNVSKKSCFCDSACVTLGDCCSDYRDHCPRELLTVLCHNHKSK